MFSVEEIQRAYEKVHDLMITRHIIKTYSTNESDIRDIALQNIDLTGVKRVLELGCGYGFFVEKLKGMLHKDAIIFGIDLVEKNREPFLNSVQACGYRAEFIRENARIISTMKDTTFDLIISSYSLYFFPDLIKEIAGILDTNGTFIVLTHSKNSLKEALEIMPQCLQETGHSAPREIHMQKLFMAFSAEDGGKTLKSYFNDVEKITYPNELVFSMEHIDDCIYYLVKKRSLIYKEIMDTDPEMVVNLESCLAQRLYNAAQKKGKIVLNKNDAVFRCKQQGPS